MNQTAGSGHRAWTYAAAMYRHVVNVLRQNGATNTVPVLNLMGSQKWATQSWFKDLYPGDSYVGWLAFARLRDRELRRAGRILPPDDESLLRLGGLDPLARSL